MSTNPQASIKLSGTLESSDLLGFPILLNLTTRFYGSGEIKAFNRVTVNERNDVLQPDPLPGVAPKHAVKKVYMYLKNTSSEENQNINVYPKRHSIRSYLRYCYQSQCFQSDL